jgi:TonB family protein
MGRNKMNMPFSIQPAARIAIALVILVAATNTLADARSDFDRAYGAYQKHIDANETELATLAAKDALRFGSKAFGKNSVNTANLAVNYARLLNDAGDHKKARSTMKGKLKLLEKRFGDSDVNLVPAVMELGRAAKEPGPGLAHFERVALISRNYENSLLEAQKNFDIVRLLLAGGASPARVQPYVDRAYEIYSERLQPNDFRLGLMSYHKARRATSLQDHDAAVGYLQGSLVAFAGPEGEPLSDLERNMREMLVRTYEIQGRRSEATDHCLVLGKDAVWSATPRPIHRSEPVLPEDAFDKRLEGNVTLSFTIDEQGFVVNPTITESTQVAFNQATLDMIDGFRYAPRFVDGEPVATKGVEYTARYSFETEQSKADFKRPGQRGFISPDLTDQSNCGTDEGRYGLECQNFGVGGGK